MKPHISRATRRALDRLAPEIDAVTDKDAEFFLQNPTRNHHCRLSISAEVRINALMKCNVSLTEVPAMRWHTIVRQLKPGVRMRVYTRLEAGTVMTEAGARAHYERLAGERGSVAAILLIAETELAERRH